MQPGAVAFASFDGGEDTGVRDDSPMPAGHTSGPLFAESPATEGEIITALVAHVRGDASVFGTPDRNPATVVPARTNGMEEVFGTARIFPGRVPGLALEPGYGITFFERGRCMGKEEGLYQPQAGRFLHKPAYGL